MTDHDLEFKDFSLATAEPKRFKIDADIFEAPARLPAVVFAELSSLRGKLGALTTVKDDDDESAEDSVPIENLTEIINMFADVFRLVLTPASGERFAARLLSRDEPIDLFQQAVPALHWLLEVYGLRPTVPPSSSANGSGGDGTGSTDGAPNAESPILSS